jgi:nitrogen fixation protein
MHILVDLHVVVCAGEDRWMCTLMMLHGWKLEYTSFCNNTTYCPDSYDVSNIP